MVNTIEQTEFIRLKIVTRNGDSSSYVQNGIATILALLNDSSYSASSVWKSVVLPLQTDTELSIKTAHEGFFRGRASLSTLASQIFK